MIQELRDGRLGAFIVGQVVGSMLILLGVLAGEGAVSDREKLVAEIEALRQRVAELEEVPERRPIKGDPHLLRTLAFNGNIIYGSRVATESQIIFDAANALEEMDRQIRELRAERDEARRWICHQKASMTSGDAEWWARTHTWDCFGEVKP